MIRSIDTLQKNFEILQKRQETTASNLANSQTTGFQSKKVFQQTLEEVNVHNFQGGIAADKKQELGSWTFGNELAQTALNTSKGAFKETGRMSDFALTQEGYFTIAMPDGSTSYTKNGNFALNDQNQYITQAGYLVLNEQNQPVLVGTDDFQVRRFNQPEALENIANTYYQTEENGEVILNPVLEKGYLEMANVEVADEMTALLQTSRQFEANQKVLSIVNDTF